MKKGKKLVTVICMCFVLILTGCSSNSQEITVVSREDGSGTRGAFVEAVGVVDKDDNDITTLNAEITNSTSVVIQSVISNVNSIGYISIGALSEDIKGLNIDGVPASPENVNSGEYKISRPFSIIEKKGTSIAAKNFISYVLSDQGQKIVENAGFVALKGNGKYEKKEIEGKVVIAGSTSVGPLMEVLAQEYMEINPQVEIEIQQTGSTAGIESTLAGACDIGMSSRNLKESETSKGLKETVIARDGIAVIVNKNNPCSNLQLEDVRDIFAGKISNWNNEELKND